MSGISIELDDVARRSQEMYKLFRSLDVILHDLSSVGSRIDERIAKRRSIDLRMRDNRTKLRVLEKQLSELELFMRESIERYRMADRVAQQDSRDEESLGEQREE